MDIKKINTEMEIESCFNVFSELRPHVKNKLEFCDKVSTQMREGYQIIAAVDNGNVVGCIGYRVLNTLAWDKILYIDDLITTNNYRRNNCGTELLNYAINHAKALNCTEVHLDTGYTRYEAHKLYLKQGFQLACHHLSLKIS
ncbi:MAG: GNAT family N-acetyltransferase [Burkholderiales bacterium]